MESDNDQPVNTEGLCFAEDTAACDHGHITLMDTDPVLGYLAEVLEKGGLKRGGIQYGNPGD